MPGPRLYAMFLVILLGCSDTTGPTTEGPPFLFALVDNASWSPEPSNVSSVLFADGHFFLHADRFDSLGRLRDGLQVRVAHLTGLGQYPLGPDSFGDAGLFSLIDAIAGSVTNFASDTGSLGELTITGLDTVAHRVAGQFSFDAQQLGGTRIIHVEQGEFRAVYQYVPQPQ